MGLGRLNNIGFTAILGLALIGQSGFAGSATPAASPDAIDPATAASLAASMAALGASTVGGAIMGSAVFATQLSAACKPLMETASPARTGEAGVKVSSTDPVSPTQLKDYPFGATRFEPPAISNKKTYIDEKGVTHTYKRNGSSANHDKALNGGRLPAPLVNLVNEFADAIKLPTANAESICPGYKNWGPDSANPDQEKIRQYWLAVVEGIIVPESGFRERESFKESSGHNSVGLMSMSQGDAACGKATEDMLKTAEPNLRCGLAEMKILISKYATQKSTMPLIEAPGSPQQGMLRDYWSVLRPKANPSGYTQFAREFRNRTNGPNGNICDLRGG